MTARRAAGVDAGGPTAVSRIDRNAIRGGCNVYPREIQEVRHEHPDVREAAVIGNPHDDLGEEVAVVVALHVGNVVARDIRPPEAD